MSKPKVRNVCFTVNKPERHLLRLLDFTHSTWTHVKYCVYQREMAAHEHFQGYIEFTAPVSYEHIHSMEGLEGAHLEKRKGPAKSAAHYCKKPVLGCTCHVCDEERSSPTYLEGPWEYGEMSTQGVRADLLEVKRDIDRGVPLKRIAADPDTFPTWIKYHKGLETYKRITTSERDHKPLVVLFIGPSGTGKTRTAMCLARYLGSVYKVPPKATGFWCDDYGQEDTFLIDEMDGNKMTPTFFNELVDWAPMTVPSHGSAGHQFNSKRVFITTNYHPKYWWRKRSEDQVKQTMRRIDIIIKMFNPPKPAQLCPHCAIGLCAFHHI